MCSNHNIPSSHITQHIWINWSQRNTDSMYNTEASHCQCSLILLYRLWNCVRLGGLVQIIGTPCQFSHPAQHGLTFMLLLGCREVMSLSLHKDQYRGCCNTNTSVLLLCLLEAVGHCVLSLIDSASGAVALLVNAIYIQIWLDLKTHPGSFSSLYHLIYFPKGTSQ